MELIWTKLGSTLSSGGARIGVLVRKTDSPIQGRKRVGGCVGVGSVCYRHISGQWVTPNGCAQGPRI